LELFNDGVGSFNGDGVWCIIPVSTKREPSVPISGIGVDAKPGKSSDCFFLG
jgi:hypothetical protein